MLFKNNFKLKSGERNTKSLSVFFVIQPDEPFYHES